MSKKLLIRLAPLFAIAAFAVVPAAAQAAVGSPHWHKGVGGASGTGTLQPEGKPIPTITWGGETNLSQTSNIGEVNCKTVGAGYIENPTASPAEKTAKETGQSGPAGVGETQQSAYYECKGADCAGAVAEGKAGLGELSFLDGAPGEGAVEAVAENLPWHNQLALSGTSETGITETIGEPWTKFNPWPKHPNGSGAGAEPGSNPQQIQATVFCTVRNPTFPVNLTPSPRPNYEYGRENLGVVLEAQFEGELKPEIGGGLPGKASVNGGGVSCEVPAYAKFNQAPGPPAGSGALESAVAGKGENSGNVKYCGYANQTYLRVFAP